MSADTRRRSGDDVSGAPTDDGGEPRPFAAISGAAFGRIRNLLQGIAAHPPQVLLMEGGSEAQRLAMARWWAACCSCPSALAGGEIRVPCRSCPTCLQIDAGEYLDVRTYDGRIGNREDEENPGPIRAVSMENMRALKRDLGDAPRGGGLRVVILMELPEGRAAAANALLKVLEEPSPHTIFVLLAAQRERLLPTLVSRSLCLTLPWPDPLAADPDVRDWEDCLASFIRNGTGLLDRTSAKNALDAAQGRNVILAWQKSLARALSGHPSTALDAFFAALPREELAPLRGWFDEAQNAILMGVTPARVVEALAMRLHVHRLEAVARFRRAEGGRRTGAAS